MAIFVFFGSPACPCQIKNPAAKEALPGAPWLPLGIPIPLISTLAGEGSNAHGKECEESAKAELS